MHTPPHALAQRCLPELLLLDGLKFDLRLYVVALWLAHLSRSTHSALALFDAVPKTGVLLRSHLYAVALTLGATDGCLSHDLSQNP